MFIALHTSASLLFILTCTLSGKVNNYFKAIITGIIPSEHCPIASCKIGSEEALWLKAVCRVIIETRTEGFKPWPGRLFGPYLNIYRAI